MAIDSDFASQSDEQVMRDFENAAIQYGSAPHLLDPTRQSYYAERTVALRNELKRRLAEGRFATRRLKEYQ